MAKRQEENSLNISKYNCFIETVKRKGNPSFTQVLNGIFLLHTTSSDKKTFYVKKESGYDIFKSNQNRTFVDIEENKRFRCLEKVYSKKLNKSYPSWISGGNTSYRDSYEIGDGSRSKNIYSSKYYEHLSEEHKKNFSQYIKDISGNENNLDNVITDKSLERIYFSITKDNDKIEYRNKSNAIKNQLELKVNIDLNEEKLNSFDNEHYFIHLP